MAEWSRVVNTTIHKYIREVEPNVLRNRKLLAVLKERGRITFGHSGDLLDWKVQYKRAPIQGYADTDVLTFARRDRWKTAQLDWRGYAATDAMTKKERLMNRNTEAIIKVYSEIATHLMEDIEDHFGDQLYVDGNAAGNEKFIHGMESFFGVSGANASAPIGTPSDTYAGLSTALGNYGGSWSGNWPTGTGDSHYDFWSPLVVDYTSNVTAANGGFSQGTSSDWTNIAVEAIRFGLIKSRKNKSAKGMVDLALFNDDMYRQLVDQLDSKERLIIKRADKKGGLYALGFEDMVNIDGCDISYEYGVPTTVGYGFPIEMMELCSMQDSLFVPTGPDEDISTMTHRFSIDYFGNMRMRSIRNAIKWDNVS